MIVSSEPLDEVRYLKVTPTNPESDSSDHLDFERCAALHNAIVKHTWVATGRDLKDLPIQHVWPPDDESALQEGLGRLHPDVISFLERAIVNPEGEFFLYIGYLGPAKALWEQVDALDLDEDAVALYLSHDDSSLSGIDIIYDQEYHCCKYNGSCHEGNFPESSTEWQRLETMLSAWIELIERGKVVALHHSIKPMQDRGEYDDSASYEDGKTGARLAVGAIHDPWAVPPFAKQDLADTLDAWQSLVNAINNRLPEPRIDPFTSESLHSPDTLEAAEIRKNCFAWEFFTKAKRPVDEIVFLGPELKLPTDEEIINNKWRIAEEQSGTRRKNETSLLYPGEDPFNFPLPILIGSKQTKDWSPSSMASSDQMCWGLYLDFCHIEGSFPVEDGCRLALPYPLGANGFAIRANGSALNAYPNAIPGELELYQIGTNPFMPCCPTQLYMVLAAFAQYVQSGLWKVGAHGADELDTVFQNADTEDGRYTYALNVYNVE